MKRIIVVALLFAGVTAVKSQHIYFETGKSISSFHFENSQGESLKNLQKTDHVFMSLGYRRSIFTKNLYLSAEGIYNSYGAIGSDRDVGNYFEWDVTYLGARVGLDYELFHTGNFTYYIKGAASAEFLIRGTQTLNDQVYTLRGENDFDTPIYFLRGGLGIQYKVSPKLSVFTQYLYGRSGTFKNIEGKLNINAHNFGFGLLINISKDVQDISEYASTQIVQLKKELEENTQKVKEMEETVKQVDELEEVIIAKEEEIQEKEEEIQTLHESISSALMPYDGKGLTVEERNGKVYVTMENDMLFQSGSWKIGTEGEEAVTVLGEVLADNPEVTVLIEGHTDNEPFRGSGNINSNWDLSTKRATAIVEILMKNQEINPRNLTAAGRGEFDPIADNSTPEGKAINRRIEVILTPKLEEVYKLIEK